MFSKTEWVQGWFSPVQILPVVCLQREGMKGKVLIQSQFNLESFEAGSQRTHQTGSLKCC